MLFCLLILREIEIMRVLLISANTELINMATLPLGLACVASATRHAGYDVELLDLLIHDDIIDRDSLRRGSPTIHKLYQKKYSSPHFGESMAIVLGDICSVLGSEAILQTNFPEKHKLKAIDKFNKGIIEAGLDINWRCILYPGNISEPLIHKMMKAGCKEVSLGFESGSERILKRMNKGFTLKEVRRASKMLAEYGIHRIGFLLLGGPGENKKSVEESLSFVDSIDLDFLKFTIGIRIYPGTELAGVAVEEGVVSEDDDLLFPRFYMAKEIEDWLRETVNRCLDEHHNWMT